LLQKKLRCFFASPIAYLFLVTFAAVTLFVFFWGEAFFARNIADVRPLFEWMPVLLIFLASTLTMRMWSEERRTGTLEYILTQPVPLWHFVAGKYLGCLSLLLVALIVTLPLPISVAIIAELDWGPVIAGYLATFLLGAAYMSVGLFVSARSDNQIVSLITATFVCTLLYVVGTPTITDFFGNQAGEWLRLLGTGSRFDSITRGVIDLRDLYYYISIVAVFLALNTYVLEKERWASTGNPAQHRLWKSVTALLLVNALAMNLWLGQLHKLRIDATSGNQYSISSATQSYLDQLQEPLLLRGYFSSKTHPLLAPLVPQLKDLLEEYQVAGQGRVKVELIDPANEPELEQEANQKYGIQPVPFQVADRYQAAIVSSYFNVLVQYGDEYQVLSFSDLIEVQARSEAEIDVQLRNPEHDLTRAIKKVLNAYQSNGNLFETLSGDLRLVGYLSADKELPEALVNFKTAIQKVLDEVKADAGGRFTSRFIDPDAEGVDFKQRLLDDFGFQPMSTNLLSNERFYFYLTLEQGDNRIQLPLGDLSEGEFQRNLEAGIKRFAKGFTKTVAVVTPPKENPYGNPYAQGPASEFQQLKASLETDLNVVSDDLSDGKVEGATDLLVLVSPSALTEKQLFAVDQFLMKGGTVLLATSPYSAQFANRSLALQSVDSGLQDWLQQKGISIDKTLILDKQSGVFPVPVTRQAGAFSFQEMRMLDYPYFVDIRGAGLNPDNPIVSRLPNLVMPWASPISLDQTALANVKVTELLKTSDQAWLSDSTEILPKMTADGINAFRPEGSQGSQLVGVSIQGRFDSYFADKDSPLLADAVIQEDRATEADAANSDKETPNFGSLIKRSPDSARIILFSSNDFLKDQIMRLVGSSQQSEYLSAVQLMANAVDWSLEDTALLSIRSRGHFNRTLPPMEQNTQWFWEYGNYFIVLLLIGIIALVHRQLKRNRERYYQQTFIPSFATQSATAQSSISHQATGGAL
jgi:ABC-2 type transport system permease protein